MMADLIARQVIRVEKIRRIGDGMVWRTLVKSLNDLTK